jgi:hypothetical protein
MDAFFLRFIKAERHERPVLAAGLAAAWTGLAVYLGSRMKSWNGARSLLQV